MNENILVPILIALGPGFSALLFVSRLRINYWLNAILGGSGWLIALMIRFPLLVLINSLSVFPRIFMASLAAGVFEETIRYLVVRHRVGKEKLYSSISLGLGWGLAEALIIYVLQVPLASAVYGYNWVELLPGAVERNTAIVFHLAMTLVATIAATRSPWIVLIAITMHTLLNITAGLAVLYMSDPWIIEGVLGLLVSILIIPVVIYAENIVKECRIA